MTETAVNVIGLGVISGIGNNVAEHLAAFAEGRDGIGSITTLDTVHRDELPVAEVKLSNSELIACTNLPARSSRTALLSMAAAREAWEDAGMPAAPSLRTGFISANTVGGMDKSEHFFVDFVRDSNKGRLRYVFDHECGSMSEIVAEGLGIREFVTTVSTACSSSANAVFYAARLIRAGMLDVALAGGADALTKFTLNGFNTLMILDKERCRPFDAGRQGLNLGEGAGYVLLASDKAMEMIGKKPYCRVSGFCNRNDAYHQTASSPEGLGSYLAMKGALERSGLLPSDIDYINLHGTGTANNDSSEGLAIKRLFEPQYPPMSSTKSFTGHTLGASGGVEAVFSALSIAKGLIYPNLRFEKRPEELPFEPETSFRSGQPVRNVLSNSFGFGGNCTSLVFSAL